MGTVDRGYFKPVFMRLSRTKLTPSFGEGFLSYPLLLKPKRLGGCPPARSLETLIFHPEWTKKIFFNTSLGEMGNHYLFSFLWVMMQKWILFTKHPIKTPLQKKNAEMCCYEHALIIIIGDPNNLTARVQSRCYHRRLHRSFSHLGFFELPRRVNANPRLELYAWQDCADVMARW